MESWKIVELDDRKIVLHIISILHIPIRSAALLLSLQHLVLVTKQACQMSSYVEWIDGSIKQMESHLQVSAQPLSRLLVFNIWVCSRNWQTVVAFCL